MAVTGAATVERCWPVETNRYLAESGENAKLTPESFFTGRLSLNRKVLADLAVRDLAAFGTLVAKPE